MKQQLSGQKVGNRAGLGNKARTGSVTQKAAKRGRDSNEKIASRVRSLLPYAPGAMKIALVIATGVVVFLGYRAAASASFFQIRRVETRGLTRASAEAIEEAVRQDVKPTGVWRADLLEISSHLEELPWVRKAVVTRVLPDGIRVRIVERQPRVVVRNSAGRFIWVDEDAVLLEDMKPADPVPTFFLRGWNEEQSSAARAENRDRVAKLLELQRDWDAQGLSERVSEVSLLDLRDVRAQLAGDDSHIEIRLGAQDHGRRLRDGLNVLDRQRQTPRGAYISYIDLTQGKRAIVGLNTGGRTFAESEAMDSRPADPVPANRGDKPSPDRTAKEKDVKGRTQTKKSEQRRT